MIGRWLVLIMHHPPASLSTKEKNIIETCRYEVFGYSVMKLCSVKEMGSVYKLVIVDDEPIARFDYYGRNLIYSKIVGFRPLEISIIAKVILT